MVLKLDHVKTIAAKAAAKKRESAAAQQKKVAEANLKAAIASCEKAILAAANKGEDNATVRFDSQPPTTLLAALSTFNPKVSEEDDSYWLSFSWEVTA